MPHLNVLALITTTTVMMRIIIIIIIIIIISRSNTDRDFESMVWRGRMSGIIDVCIYLCASEGPQTGRSTTQGVVNAISEARGLNL